MELTNTTDTSGRIRAFVDIAIPLAASAVAHRVEISVADRLPWGEKARGVVAVLVGALTALWLTWHRGRSLSALGFRQPKRWSTVPWWTIGIFAALFGAQFLAPANLGAAFIPTEDGTLVERRLPTAQRSLDGLFAPDWPGRVLREAAGRPRYTR